ncbi:carbohydrate kinase family protein [Coraliomargarita parva]|uniref:carbohydrate kinase family protein n=1 Tax=Coraliomargarita parva TaxID=3014050 RepID=UPI0022B3D94E|nr:carbohydrate kinase family protein [Coraliomargarita parva]
MQKYIDYISKVSGKILLGCDGFVDEVYQIVSERKSLTEYTPMNQLKHFGELIVERADGGVGLEIVHKRRCEGGFGINTGRVAGMLGLQPSLAGLFGASETDPAFAPFEDICQLISLGDPALTLAFEFSDGKVLMSDLKTVANLTWEDFVAHFGKDKLKTLFADVDILGLGYWSLTPDFDNLLKGFVSQYDDAKTPKRMFFDFADIKKKSAESFTKSLGLITQFNAKIPMTLSMNEHEVFELLARIGIESPGHDPARIASALTAARQKIGIDELVVHTPTFAAASSKDDGEAFAMQETQTNVIRTAGAGDTFNGGYLCASLGDLTVKERLVIANAATAFFVTHASPPTKEEIIAQIEQATDK